MALKSIPASQIVSVVPSALATGGDAYNLNGVFFTSNAPYPVKQYASADDVLADFGENAEAYKFSVIYFNGVSISTKKPSALFIVRFNQTDTSAKVIGASQKSKSLSDLQTVKGNVTVTVDGTEKSADIDLSTATSWSNAAETIATALSANVTFDTQLQAFVITSAKTGADSSISYASGTGSDQLGLSSTGGAYLDNQATADTIVTLFARLKSYTLNFGGYGHDSTFTTDQLKTLMKYTSGLNHDVWGVITTLEAQALINGSDQCLGAWVKENDISDVTLTYGDYQESAIALGFMASLDFSKENGRMTLDFRNTSSGVSARITDSSDATALTANGYMFYGAYATRSQRLIFLRNSKVSGDFAWADTYLNQLRLNGQLQNAVLNGLVENGNVPYNAKGQDLIRSWCQDPISELLNFGGIQTGITLSESQKAKINSLSSDFDVATQLYTAGYVLIIEQATAQVREARGSFPITLVYTDGGSVHTINIASMAVL